MPYQCLQANRLNVAQVVWLCHQLGISRKSFALFRTPRFAQAFLSLRSYGSHTPLPISQFIASLF
jgi:hypothetical protein